MNSSTLKLPNSQTDSENLAICLTDAPRVVALKREFCELDLREEELKRWVAGDLNARLELQAVRARKGEIARRIFGAPETE